MHLVLHTVLLAHIYRLFRVEHDFNKLTGKSTEHCAEIKAAEGKMLRFRVLNTVNHSRALPRSVTKLWDFNFFSFGVVIGLSQKCFVNFIYLFVVMPRITLIIAIDVH